MKKSLLLIIVIFSAIGLIAMVGCSKKSETPAPAPTATLGVDFSAASQATGWTVSDQVKDTDGISAVAWDGTAGAGFNGSTGCLSTTANFNHDTVTNTMNAKGAIQYAWGSTTPINLHTDKIIFHVNIPQAMVTQGKFGVQLQMNTGSGWTYADGGWNNVTTAGWQAFTWDLATTPPSGGADATSVDKIAFQFTDTNVTSTAGAMTILFDDISY